MRLQEWLSFAVEAAFQAGQLTLGYFQRQITVERKADTSPVTIADREAEELLRYLIEQKYPEHGILGEEFGEKVSSSALTWIIDPIDGTKSFIHGVPLYGVLIALVEEGYPLVGVLHFPALRDTIYAAREIGCYWNGKRVHVSRVVSLSEATLLTSGLEGFRKFPEKWQVWERLMKQTAIQRTWGDAYGYALVATGRAEIMLDPEMSIWDAAPVQVVLEEAGGYFMDWKGVSTIEHQEGIGVNRVLKEPLLEVLAST